MLTLIAASIAAAPAAQPVPASPHAQHAQHAQHQQQGNSEPQQRMAKMEGCCCCKEMAANTPSGHGSGPKGEEHKGH